MKLLFNYSAMNYSTNLAVDSTDYNGLLYYSTVGSLMDVLARHGSFFEQWYCIEVEESQEENGFEIFDLGQLIKHYHVTVNKDKDGWLKHIEKDGHLHGILKKHLTYEKIGKRIEKFDDVDTIIKKLNNENNENKLDYIEIKQFQKTIQFVYIKPDNTLKGTYNNIREHAEDSLALKANWSLTTWINPVKIASQCVAMGADASGQVFQTAANTVRLPVKIEGGTSGTIIPTAILQDNISYIKTDWCHLKTSTGNNLMNHVTLTLHDNPGNHDSNTTLNSNTKNVRDMYIVHDSSRLDRKVIKIIDNIMKQEKDSMLFVKLIENADNVISFLMPLTDAKHPDKLNFDKLFEKYDKNRYTLTGIDGTNAGKTPVIHRGTLVNMTSRDAGDMLMNGCNSTGGCDYDGDTQMPTKLNDIPGQILKNCCKDCAKDCAKECCKDSCKGNKKSRTIDAMDDDNAITSHSRSPSKRGHDDIVIRGFKTVRLNPNIIVFALSLIIFNYLWTSSPNMIYAIVLFGLTVFFIVDLTYVESCNIWLIIHHIIMIMYGIINLYYGVIATVHGSTASCMNTVVMVLYLVGQLPNLPVFLSLICRNYNNRLLYSRFLAIFVRFPVMLAGIVMCCLHLSEFNSSIILSQLLTLFIAICMDLNI